VKSGTSKVERISHISHVSRPDVYRTVRKLQEIGLVECKINRPLMFKAIPPKIALNGLLKNKKERLNNLDNQTKTLVSNLEKMQNKSYRDNNEFVLVPSKDALISKLRQEIDKSKKCIEILTTCKRLQFACYSFPEALSRAWQRNVKCRLIIERPSEEQIKIFRKCYPKPWTEIRFLSEKPSTVIALFDKKEVFIMTRSDAGLRDSPALWSKNSCILSINNYYLESLWKKANPIDHIPIISI
jgi:sugar-specific transcriptional regulator TrmB